MSTVYIFGSGASKYTGIPITHNFLDTVINEKIASSALDVDCSKEKVGYELPNDFHRPFLERFEKFKKVSMSTSIETYLNWYTEQNYSDEYDRQLMQMIVWYFYDRSHHASTIRFHDLFVTKIFKPEDIIISFNYDLIIEDALINNGYKARNGARYGEVYVKDEFECQLLKPMGSVNLHSYDKDKGFTDSIYWANGYVEVSYIKYVMKWFGIPRDVYSSVYIKCNEKIKSADKVVSLGYAFPQTDKEELDIIFNNCTKEIDLVCGKDFIAPWTKTITYKNQSVSFEEWVLRETGLNK
ncbi:MAG: hypothetical protein JXR81_06640 [Candidatus Goldbacteria bacterium]|nr:hypothetical protein [Candidatus Goldiibacteriota bacterium]